MLAMRGAIRFDRNESCGDLGADLPLITGTILAAGLDSAGVFIGLFRIHSLEQVLHVFPRTIFSVVPLSEPHYAASVPS